MKPLSAQTDEELLGDLGRPGDSFEEFYRRHVAALIAYFARRCACAQQAADLTAETFAAALIARSRFDHRIGDARGWLFGIAAKKLADSRRRWAREDKARRRLGLVIPRLSEQDHVEYDALVASNGELEAALAELPASQRAAVEARVLDELSYRDVGERLGIDPQTARQRVSRGLAVLRHRAGEDRA